MEPGFGTKGYEPSPLPSLPPSSASQDNTEAPLPNVGRADLCWPSDPVFFGVDTEYFFPPAQHDPFITGLRESVDWMTCPTYDTQLSVSVGGLVEDNLDLHNSDRYNVLMDLPGGDELLRVPTMSPFAAVVERTEGLQSQINSYSAANTDTSAASRNASQPYTCAECQESHTNILDFWRHWDHTNHNLDEHGCHDCSFTAPLRSDLLTHFQTVHALLTCHECDTVFEFPANLDDHVGYTGHSGYKCGEQGCEQTFSRMDTYRRHTRLHRDDVGQYPCPHCKRHRDSSAFKRKDHLTQHLRNYHHIGEEEVKSLFSCSCPREGCSEHNVFVAGSSYDPAFKTLHEYTKHMKKVHDESPFPCSEPGCSRVGGKGYFRKRDLIKHQKKEHLNGQVQ